MWGFFQGQSGTVGRDCLSAYRPGNASGPTSHWGPATAPRSQQVMSKKGEKCAFWRAPRLTGRPTEGQGCSGEHAAGLCWTLVRERQRAATGVRRKDKCSDGPASCPWASWELQPKSSSEKAVVQTQPLPGRLHPQTSLYLGRLCAPSGDIPLSTHHGGMPRIRSVGRWEVGPEEA